MSTTNTVENKEIEVKIDTIPEEEKTSTEIPKTQEDNVVIDVSEQTREAETSEPEKKKKKANIFKQFLIPKVYYTALCAYLLQFMVIQVYYWIIDFLQYVNVINKNETLDSSNQQGLEDEMGKIYTNRKLLYFYIAYIVLIGPIIEELIFRLLLFRGISWIGEKTCKNNEKLRKFIKFLAYFISSFIFAYGHFDFDFHTFISEILVFPDYFIAGLAFAMAYDYEGYFLAAVLTHILNNSIATIIMVFEAEKYLATAGDLIVFSKFLF